MPPLEKPMPPTAEAVLTDIARAREELRKLGVDWQPPLEERVYAALLDLPPTLQRPARRQDLVAYLGVPSSTLTGALSRLMEQGRVLRPLPGVWVAVG